MSQSLCINIRGHEKRVFSQNKEDGIIEYLVSLLKSRSNKFVEIGASDGKENNGRYLLECGYEGLSIEADWEKALRYQVDLDYRENTVLACLVDADSLEYLVPLLPSDIDVFSVDIDSYDFFIVDYLLRACVLPSVWVLETNTYLGSESILAPYQGFEPRYDKDPRYGLAFGVSVPAWRSLLESHGYRFLGLDSSNTNAFFVHPSRIVSEFSVATLPIIGPQRFFDEKYRKAYSETFKDIQSYILKNFSNYLLHYPSEKYDEQFNFCFSKGFSKNKEIKSHKVRGRSMSASFVTTFNTRIFEEVAKDSITSFLENWPESYKLFVASEDVRFKGNPRLISLNLRAAEGYKDFLDRHRFNPGANGFFGKKYDYIHDAIRWSHKVFAVELAANFCKTEYLIYFDSDIFTFEKVPENFLVNLIPRDADISYLPRVNMYSECSFVVYKLTSPKVRKFIKDHCDFYRSDNVFALSGWTDCHIFDYLYSMARKDGLRFHNINDGVKNSSHPFINGPLGKYMDHKKGARKTEGKSRDSDLVVERTEAYWNSKNVSN